MNKNILLTCALTVMSVGVQAQRSPSHPMDIPTMNFTEWITAFKIWEAGKPLNGVTAMDEEFYTSRVKPRKRITDTEGDYSVRNDVKKERKMCLWTPLDDPTSTWKAFPRYCFEGDNFSMWQYLDSHGNWTAPWVRVSSGLSDVAAKNGVKVGCLLSIPWQKGVYLTEEAYWHNDYSRVLYELTELNNDNTTYKYSKKLVEFMKYYGVNSIGVNSEFESDTESMKRLLGFFRECHKKAKELNWEFNVNWYDLTSFTGDIITGANALGSHNQGVFGEGGNEQVDMFFLNYNWTGAHLANSARRAKTIKRSSYDIYAGFDIQKKGMQQNSWIGLLNSEVSIGFWGAHSQSLIHQSATDNGTSDIAIQKAYLDKQELIFSGGYKNPAITPEVGYGTTLANAALMKFHGLSNFLTAKSTINKIPFVSRFNLGNGLKFRNQGKTTFEHKWYNLNTQDFLPTWRWWITNKSDQVGTNDVKNFIQANLSFDDAYFGGSCLQFHGKTDFSRVKLFKTMLPVESNYVLSITYKLKKDATTHAKLFVALKNALTQYKEIEIPANVQTLGNWTTFKTTMKDLGVTSNSDIAMIGLTFEGTPEDYNCYVGELSLTNPTQTFNTAQPKIEEVKILRGRYNALDFKLHYSNKGGKTDTKVYNDDVDTWYYEIYYQQQGEPEQLLTATTSWAAYVVDAPIVKGKERKARFGVRAVAPDGSVKNDIVWSEYKEIPYNQAVYDVAIDKAVVKPGEEFNVKLVDELGEPAQKWRVVDPLTGNELASATNSIACKAKIDKVGLYDLYLTDSKGTNIITRGMVQVTPESTGRVPSIESLTASKNEASTGEKVTLNYKANKGEGKVSRALEIIDPKMLCIPADVQVGTTYSYALWFKVKNLSHDKQGTNLINKNSIYDEWPHNNWGDLWVTIRPKWENPYTHEVRPENEISFNTMGWESHDIPNSKMISRDYQITPGVWNHLVVTQDGQHQKMYFNGKKVADTNFNGSKRRETRGDSRIKSNKKADIFIGGGGVYKAGFNGWIDEVQVWNKALTDEEVLKAMQGYQPNEVPEGLQAYYTFEETDSEHKFANHGKSTISDSKAYLVEMVGSGGENTATASYQTRLPNIDVLGYPGIPGSLDVKATTEWNFDAASIVEEGEHATISYMNAGSYNGTLTIENRWGKAVKQLDNVIVVTGESTGINNVEENNDITLTTEPLLDNVNIAFAEGGNYSIGIVNANGVLLQNTRVNVTNNQVVNTKLTGAKGLYIVVIKKDNKVCKTVKVVKR